MAAKKKKAAAKKAVTKKTTKKKVVAKKASTKKVSAKKAVAKKTSKKKSAAKKTSKKVATKKTTKPISNPPQKTSGNKTDNTQEPETLDNKVLRDQPEASVTLKAQTEEAKEAVTPVKIPSHPAKQGFFARNVQVEEDVEPFEADEDTGVQVNFVSEKKRSDNDITKLVAEVLEQIDQPALTASIKELRKMEQSSQFKQLFGWDLPMELAAWIEPGLPEYGMCSWDVDNFDLDELLNLDSEDEITEFFQDIDQSLLLFMGLIPVGQHASGDEIYFDIGAFGNGFVNVVALNNDALTGYIESYSLSLFALKMKVNNLEQIAEDFDQMFKEGEGQDWLKEYKVSSREELGKTIATTLNIIQDMQTRYKLPVPEKTDQHYSILLKRIEWIRELLIEGQCEHFSEKLTASPDWAVWKKERKLLKSSPQTLFYWMLAHFFFDNPKACQETIKVARKSASAVLKGFADAIERLLKNPGNDMFGNIKAAKVVRLKESVMQNITKAHQE
ncbi:hypothetical protein MNBD_GAMMA12-392 [hydrothermal vent metagenome]|uniref:Uncharacterized protein n=1 Tax=hydrothermal vent metagenome TaxID=652676 RepID=A0A3B0YQY5_9ZZZZ